MVKKTGRSIRRRLVMTIMVNVAIALLVALGAISLKAASDFRALLTEGLRVIAELVESNAAQRLVLDDREGTSAVLASLATQPSITRAAIFDADGQIVASYARDDSAAPLLPRSGRGAELGEMATHWQSIRYAEREVGSLIIESDLDDLTSRQNELLLVLGGVFLVAGLIALGVSGVMQRPISEPILELAEIEERVTKEKNFSLRVERRSDDEIGMLYDGFNDMMSRIEEQNQALEEAKDLAIQANHTKSSFLANMSHELRTPLNAIIGYSEMLMEEAADMEPEEVTEDLQKVLGAGRHLLGLINGVLDLSKVEAGRMDVYLENVEIRELLNEVAATIKPLIDNKGNHLQLEFAADLGNGDLDVTKTRQILLNLMSNAAKFTNDGTIALRARIEDGRLHLEVADTGIGMSQEQLAKIFEPFTQADASTTRKYGGTGLGLAISKRFAELLGGFIDVSSKVGVGTCFVLELPIDGGPQSTTKTGSFSKSMVRATSTQPVQTVGSELVLVIDDDPSARDLLVGIFNREGFRVVTASNGEEGYRLAKELLPSIITLDVMMPDTDGWSVLSALKQHEHLNKIPVIMVSIVEDRQKAFSMGASEYLTKPVDRKMLHAVLERYRESGDQTVLIVEDDPDARGLLKASFEHAGWTVLTAENGEQALTILAGNDTDLILLDLLMPVMDGFTFLDHRLKNDKLAAVPVVIMTAMNIDEVERKGLIGGVNAVLQKGQMSIQELEADVRRIIEQRRQA